MATNTQAPVIKVVRRKPYGSAVALGMVTAAAGAFALWGPKPPPKQQTNAKAGPTADEILAAATPRASLDEAAAQLGVGAAQVRDLIAEGTLKAIGPHHVTATSLSAATASKLRQAEVAIEKGRAREAVLRKRSVLAGEESGKERGAQGEASARQPEALAPDQGGAHGVG